MLPSSAVEAYLNSLNQRTDFTLGDHAQAPAALPDESLHFLTDLCSALAIKHVFEFGSGRSTKALLAMGCSVTSLEDSAYWMDQTVALLTPDEKKHHTALVKPLSKQYIGLFPVYDWRIDDELKKALADAELILVDSPYYVPFRESTLWSGLTNNTGGVVVLDDCRIPTAQRFCNRIARSNSSLIHTRVPVGHVFDVFYRTSARTLSLNHSVLDVLKGWRRYFAGAQLYRNQKNKA